MGFSRSADFISRIKDCHISQDDLMREGIGKTAFELLHVTSGTRLDIPLDFSAVDSNLGQVVLVNDDFEQAELHPNYARLEHSSVDSLIVGSYVVCDLIDGTAISRMKVYGEVWVKHNATVHSMDISPIGRVIVLGCNIESMDVEGTVILMHSHVNTLNLRAGGRIFTYRTTISAQANCNRPSITGKIRLNDPYVLNLLNGQEFDYCYG